MRTLTVPWRISKQEQFALHRWTSWLRLGAIVALALAVAALVLALLRGR